MPLKQPNLIIFKNLSLIDSLRGGERQRQRQRQKRKTKATTTTTTKSPVRFAATPFKKWELTATTKDKDKDKKISKFRILENRKFPFCKKGWPETMSPDGVFRKALTGYPPKNDGE
jgi:uncharacterized protein (DUF1800 family)